jgi:exopolysaccharide biosynthesis polyprenyl glycosylphosphotransferase
MYLPQLSEAHARALGMSADLLVAGAFLTEAVTTGAAPWRTALTVAGTAAIGWSLACRQRPATSPDLDQVLVVGTGPLGRLTQREIHDGRRRREVIGHLSFADEHDDGRLGAPILGAVRDLEMVLRQRIVNEVYISASPDQRGEAQAAIRSCERFGVPFALPACGYRLARAVPACSDAIPDGYVHYLSVANKPVQLAIKRAIDVIVSAVALTLLAPLLLVTAAAVVLTSRGPVLFEQERVGLHGRIFRMLKFRSMVPDAERLKAGLVGANERSGPAFKMKRDPRVTRVGRFIRKYSIDELPQLINVLRGDMSLVGPRPTVPSEVALYEAWQRRRLSVRPGLTCVWQVSGRDQISFATWMLLDMRYIDHWNLGQDLRLLLQTLPVVLTGRGAS